MNHMSNTDFRLNPHYNELTQTVMKMLINEMKPSILNLNTLSAWLNNGGYYQNYDIGAAGQPYSDIYRHQDVSEAYFNRSAFSGFTPCETKPQSQTSSLLYNYCCCDLTSNAYPAEVLNSKVYSINDAQTTVSTPSNQTLRNPENLKILSKNDINLMILNNFPYTSSLKNVKGYSKMMVVYTCNYEDCGKEFNRTWNLLDHARQHQNIKPYVCLYCKKSFTQKGNLKKHEKVHEHPNLTERKRFRCDICFSKYTERYNFRVSSSPFHNYFWKFIRLLSQNSWIIFEKLYY